MPASYSWKQDFYISKISQRSSHSELINIKRGLMDYNRFVGFNEEQEEHNSWISYYYGTRQNSPMNLTAKIPLLEKQGFRKRAYHMFSLFMRSSTMAFSPTIHITSPSRMIRSALGNDN